MSAVTRAASVANAVSWTIPSAIDRTIVAHTRAAIKSSPLRAVRSSGSLPIDATRAGTNAPRWAWLVTAG